MLLRRCAGGLPAWAAGVSRTVLRWTQASEPLRDGLTLRSFRSLALKQLRQSEVPLLLPAVLLATLKLALHVSLTSLRDGGEVEPLRVLLGP